MLLLTSTSDIVRVVSASAGALAAHASYVDNNAGAITPGRTNTASITGATTTTIVGSPGSSVQRNVKHLSLRNTHGSVANVVNVQHYDGTNSEDLWTGTLLPGEGLLLDQEGEWVHLDANGAPYSYTVPASGNVSLTGVFAETMGRENCPEVNTTITTTGVLVMQGIYLTAGQIVSNIIMWSATTAASAPTHFMAGLFDASRNLLAASADQTSTAWGANTQYTFPMTSAYRVPVSGFYYIGFFMAATTVPTVKGGTAKTGGQLAGAAPILQGKSSSTGLTTAMPNPAGAITLNTASFWAGVS